MRHAGGFAVHTQGLIMGDAELVVLQTGGNVGVGFRIDIGIDAQLTGACGPVSPAT
jgi:hypothetical protein